MEANQIEFDVKGVGKFTALKEVTAPMFFMDRRKMTADMFGGMSELVRMESLIRIGYNSEDRVQKELSASLLSEIDRAEWIIKIKSEIVTYPERFNLQALTSPQLNDVIYEFQKARGLFRDEGTTTGESSPPAKA